MSDIDHVRAAAAKHGWTDRIAIHHPKRRMHLTRPMSPDIDLVFREDDESFRRGQADFGRSGLLLVTLDEVLALLARPEAPAPPYLATDPKED